MSRLRDIRPVLTLFLGERRSLLALGAGLAALTVLAGMALLGISGWFITATALAGLVPATALAFDVFAPAPPSACWRSRAPPRAMASGW